MRWTSSKRCVRIDSIFVLLLEFGCVFLLGGDVSVFVVRWAMGAMRGFDARRVVWRFRERVGRGERWLSSFAFASEDWMRLN